ncbi:threonine aldolase 1 isoform X1 [Leucoraja erinacea]|uniref:threonine aldolase 1 isoform X1 n=1 Tax=Leucoraja erinaceus TaxID=7782 RepID=UPI0024573818|nr:threonine aldolase 1 isoform X1 [Leucoraja erinacea]
MRSGLLRLPAAGRRWYRGSGHRAEAGPHRVIDLRSDTVSRPGAAMRAAMGSAAVGDDVYGEDPTVNELQRRAAQLFGMEAALFVPTGTMGNLISVMCHCWERGTELIVGDRAHIHIFEQGGGAQIAGVHSRVVKNLPDGTFDLNELESNIRHDYPDPHVTRTSLICLENTHNVKGGRVLPLPFLQEVRELADTYKLPIHMDGARLMNAAVALRVPASDILQHCDSVSLCLSKGLGSPVGSIIGGRKDFIERAVRLRKVLGGGMRQAGVLAAAGLISISDMVDRLEEDHRNARTFAQGIKMYATPFCEVDVDTVETNILLFTINSPRATAEEFCRRMGEVSEEEVAETGRGVRVLLFPIYGHILRAVWHLDVSEEDTRLALGKLQFVVNKLEQRST